MAFIRAICSKHLCAVRARKHSYRIRPGLVFRTQLCTHVYIYSLMLLNTSKRTFRCIARITSQNNSLCCGQMRRTSDWIFLCMILFVRVNWKGGTMANVDGSLLYQWLIVYRQFHETVLLQMIDRWMHAWKRHRTAFVQKCYIKRAVAAVAVCPV